MLLMLVIFLDLQKKAGRSETRTREACQAGQKRPGGGAGRRAPKWALKFRGSIGCRQKGQGAAAQRPAILLYIKISVMGAGGRATL